MWSFYTTITLHWFFYTSNARLFSQAIYLYIVCIQNLGKPHSAIRKRRGVGGEAGGVLAVGEISKNILLNLLIFQDALQFYDTPRNIKEALGSSHQSQKVEF